MAKMSDLNANSLSSTREDFFSVAIMCEVNNKVVDYIYGLAIFKLWNLMGDLSLADADGQKIPSTNQTIQARYSEKFLGKERGPKFGAIFSPYLAQLTYKSESQYFPLFFFANSIVFYNSKYFLAYCIYASI